MVAGKKHRGERLLPCPCTLRNASAANMQALEKV